jgi:hypothetical protein
MTVAFAALIYRDRPWRKLPDGRILNLHTLVSRFASLFHPRRRLPKPDLFGAKFWICCLEQSCPKNGWKCYKTWGWRSKILNRHQLSGFKRQISGFELFFRAGATLGQPPSLSHEPSAAYLSEKTRTLEYKLLLDSAAETRKSRLLRFAQPALQ